MKSMVACALGLVFAGVGLAASWWLETWFLAACWASTFCIAAFALLFARRMPARVARNVHREAPKEEGFRVTARSAERQRIALGVGEEAFVDAAALVVMLGSVSHTALTAGLQTWAALPAMVGFFGVFAEMCALPVVLYIFLQTRRSIEVEQERITVRGWLGIPRRLALEEGVVVGHLHAITGALPGTDVGDAFRIEVRVGNKRFFVARLKGKEAPQLVATLATSIREVSGLQVREGFSE